MPGEGPEAAERHAERHGTVLNGVRLITLVSLLVAFIKAILQHTHRFQSTTNILDTFSAGIALLCFYPSLRPPPEKRPKDRLTRWIFYDNMLDWRCLRRKDRRNQAATTSDIPMDIRSHNSSSGSPQQAQLSTLLERQSERNDPTHGDPVGLRERRPYVNNSDDVDGRVAVQGRRTVPDVRRWAVSVEPPEEERLAAVERRAIEVIREIEARWKPNLASVTSRDVDGESESEGSNGRIESEGSAIETASERATVGTRDHPESSSMVLWTPGSSSTYLTALQSEPNWQAQAGDQQHDALREEMIDEDSGEKEGVMSGKASEVPIVASST